ncbi:hypothetical protein [Embleya sp. NPDC059237]|uniref:hypothetical protein n=1 Tax=Embleya sp. NPDC059237 TaxID=3346784 RepID=UPI00369C9637
MTTKTTKTPSTTRSTGTTADTTADTEADEQRYVSLGALRRRMTAERIAYVAGSVGLVIGPHTAAGAGPDAVLGSYGAAGATLAWLTLRAGSDDHHGLLRTCHRALPVLTGAGLYAASVTAPGAAWWEWILPAAWGTVMGWMTPLTRSTDAIAIPDAPPAENVPAQRSYTYPEALAAMWEAAALAPGTRLVAIRQLAEDRPDFDAVIVAERGAAVPNLNPVALAAVFDLPTDAVSVTSIPGSGPGRMALTVAPTLGGAAGPSDLPGLWRSMVSDPGGAAPGMRLIDHKVEENRIVFRVQAEARKMIKLPQAEIARALGMTDAELCMVETNGLGDGLVSVYREHPLLDVREATVEDLTMDERGRIRTGLRHDGRPAHLALYDPVLGAMTDLIVGAPGAGKSVTLHTIMIGERISGVVSIAADAQNGMSLPEANHRIYHFGAGRAAVLATLVAAYELAQHREKVSSANGWSGFAINDPWPLVNLTLDELNLILAADADVPKLFKTAVVGLVSKFQSTGRKFGMGIRLAAQSIHLEDLGDKDKIRANAKQGTVSLGRTNSSTTQHMAADGVIPRGISIEPIPMYFGGGGNDIDAAFDGREVVTGPITAGMSWYIQGGTVYLMRNWRAVKENKTYPHLISLYESAPMPVLGAEEHEIYQRAYAEALPWAEALLLGDADDGTDPAATPIATPGGTADAPAAARPTARPATVKDRILALLADGGRKSTKDLREGIPDATPTGVSNMLSALHREGRIEQYSRGVWQLPAAEPQPDPTDAE